jgi:hypothetical protein
MTHRTIITLAALVLAFAIGQAWGGVYGNRIDKHGSRVRWLTVVDPAQGVDFEVPGHGTVSVWLEGDVLYVQSEGDQDGPRGLVVRGVVSNQIRVGFEA